MDFGLTGKRAVVSGSTAGIGFAIAAALAAEGAQAIVNGRTEARVTAAVRASGSVSRTPTSAGFPLISARPTVLRFSSNKCQRQTFWSITSESLSPRRSWKSLMPTGSASSK